MKCNKETCRYYKQLVLLHKYVPSIIADLMVKSFDRAKIDEEVWKILDRMVIEEE